MAGEIVRDSRRDSRTTESWWVYHDIHINSPKCISGKREMVYVMTTFTSDCTDCDGTGTVDDSTCGTCNGTGHEPMARSNEKPLYIS